MEGRANLCGEVRAITVEAGEDVGTIRFGLMAISSWRCQLDFPGSRLSSVGQCPRAFRHGLRATHHVKWDFFVWLTDLDCGKASPLLRSSLDLGRIPAAP